MLVTRNTSSSKSEFELVKAGPQRHNRPKSFKKSWCQACPNMLGAARDIPNLVCCTTWDPSSAGGESGRKIASAEDLQTEPLRGRIFGLCLPVFNCLKLFSTGFYKFFEPFKKLSKPWPLFCTCTPNLKAFFNCKPCRRDNLDIITSLGNFLTVSRLSGCANLVATMHMFKDWQKRMSV